MRRGGRHDDVLAFALDGLASKRHRSVRLESFDWPEFGPRLHAAVRWGIPFVHAVQTLEVKVRSAAARKIVHRLHCANCCAVAGRTSLDKLLLQRDGNLSLEYSPYLRDAEPPRQIGGRGVSVRRAAATQRAPHKVANSRSRSTRRTASDGTQGPRVQRRTR